MLRGSFSPVLVSAGALMMGCVETADVGSEEVGSGSAALTATDVDVAPECQGILQFANQASFATLDVYLPSNVAQNIVSVRAAAPFVTLADLSDVPLVGEVRLTQIHGGALAEGLITSSCVGIYDELAVSADDAAAMVELVNTASSTQLHDYLPNAWNGAVNLLAVRPFATVSQISSTSGIGPVSLRTIRNMATLAHPFENLAAAVTGLNRDADILTRFDWYALAQGPGQYSLNGMECFGIDPALLPNGTSIRSNLAGAAEVYAQVEATIDFADRFDELATSPAAGLANLSSLIAGRTFKGCYISYADDPWSGNDMAFFVDTESGFGVLTETRWSE
jgi:DNA uptake protein ComE-like DNA-binding protein